MIHIITPHIVAHQITMNPTERYKFIVNGQNWMGR